MNPVVSPGKTLAKMREDAKMKIAFIVEQAQQVYPQFPSSHAGYLGIEENGTRDYWKIRALAAVFNVPHEEMAEIVRPERCRKNSSDTLLNPLTVV